MLMWLDDTRLAASLKHLYVRVHDIFLFFSLLFFFFDNNINQKCTDHISISSRKYLPILCFLIFQSWNRDNHNWDVLQRELYLET